MFTSFTTALSSLNAHATAIDVVGNNLANMNTTGFKASVAAFHDLVTQSIGAGRGEAQAGFGVARPTIIRRFAQGAVQKSSGALDAAIQGDGFLVVRDSAGATLYHRGGPLYADKNGVLRTSTGESVQGWMESGGTLTTTGPIGDIILPVGSLKPPAASTKFSFDVNLDATAAAGATFTSAIEVFDSLGASHLVTVTYTKTATANEWDFSVTVPDSDLATPPFTPVTGSLTFDATGKLVSPASAANPTIAITGLANGAADINLTWELYDGQTPRLTQYAQPSAVAANAQDGAPPAQLIRVGLVDGGTVIAQYSNGEQQLIAQLAMAAIRNPESLSAVGNSSYQLTAQTATPAVGLPGTGGRGNIAGGAIENSTVDLAKEFTNLIVLQRGYQANTRVITTVDDLSQETINLKR